MVDENYLRKLLASGQITQEQLSQMPISGGVPNMLAQAMQGGGQMGGQDSTLYNATPGQGYQGLQSGQGVIQQTNEDGSQNAPIRIDSQPRQQMPERDMTRNAIDLPTGRGYYGKDGQVYNANGSLYLTPETQARNQAMSMAEQDRQMKIAEMLAKTEHAQAQTLSEREKLRQMGLPTQEKAPAGYSWAADGSLKAILGGPADEAQKKLPQFAVEESMKNSSSARTIGKALAALDSPAGADATGWKAYLPNKLLNEHVDPAGVDTRAYVADVGSMLVKDRSGATVTAAEEPRLMPFIPIVTDDKETVKKKLVLLQKKQEEIAKELSSFYPQTASHIVQPGQQAPAAQPTVDTGNTPKLGTVVKGYRFLGGNPSDQSRWMKV